MNVFILVNVNDYNGGITIILFDVILSTMVNLVWNKLDVTHGNLHYNMMLLSIENL